MNKSFLSIAILFSCTLLHAQTVWNGPKITFTKAPSADPTNAANQDRITNFTWITRANTRGLFNAAAESAYLDNASPTNTEWASGTLANYSSLSYQPWELWAGGPPNIPGIVGVDAVVHLISEDIYIGIKFLSWGAGAPSGGSFSYERTTAGVTAPVKLIDFTAAKKNNAVCLSWKTVAEENTAFFQVERSPDGRTFAAIGSVTAAGNSSSELLYTFTDLHPQPANFYRVQTIDQDGKFSYSRTLSFKVAKSKTLSVFPSPATNVLNVQFDATEPTLLQVIDVVGIVRKQAKIASGEVAFQLDIADLKPGVYFVVAGSEKRVVLKQ